MSTYVGMMTFLNWVPLTAAVPLQLLKAFALMEVLVVGIFTFTQPQQAEQLQYTCPSVNNVSSLHSIQKEWETEE